MSEDPKIQQFGQRVGRREIEIGLALTEARYLLEETREYIFPWTSPSSAKMRQRIEECIPKIKAALALELDSTPTIPPSIVVLSQKVSAERLENLRKQIIDRDRWPDFKWSAHWRATLDDIESALALVNWLRGEIEKWPSQTKK